MAGRAAVSLPDGTEIVSEERFTNAEDAQKWADKAALEWLAKQPVEKIEKWAKESLAQELAELGRATPNSRLM